MLEVLLIDDDELVRQSLEMLLSHEGFTVATASDGNQALDLAKTHGFDLVISDVRMPGLDGFQCITQIREILPEANFVLISGYSEQDAPIQALRMQVDDFFRKPFDLDLFMDRIRKIRRARQQKRQRADHQALDTLVELLRTIPAYSARTDAAEQAVVATASRLGLDSDQIRVLKSSMRLLDLVTPLPEAQLETAVKEEPESLLEQVVHLLGSAKMRPVSSDLSVQLLAGINHKLNHQPLEALALTDIVLQEAVNWGPFNQAHPLEAPPLIDHTVSDFRIVTLGETRIWRKQHEIPSTEWESIRSRWLFLYLLSRKGRTVSQEKLRDRFWPDADADRAQRSLVNAIYRCRKALGDPDLILRTDRGYCINPERNIWWDVEQVHLLSAKVKASEPSSESWVKSLQQIEELFQGSFAPDCSEEWADYVRSDCQRCILESLTLLAGHLLRSDPTAAEMRARRVLKIEPTDETAASILLEALWSQDRRNETIKFYRDFSQRYERELSLPPSTEFIKLYLRLTQLT